MVEDFVVDLIGEFCCTRLCLAHHMSQEDAQNFLIFQKLIKYN